MKASIRILILSIACVLTTSAWAAKIHLKDGSVISGRVEKANSEKIEVVTSLGVRMTIPMESITAIEYGPRELGIVWKPSTVRRSIQYRAVRDLISFGAGLARFITLTSAKNAASAAGEASRRWEWNDVREHVEDAKRMSKVNHWLFIGDIVAWASLVGFFESREEKESYEMFIAEQGSEHRGSKLVGEIIHFGGSLLCWYYSYRADATLDSDKYSKASGSYTTAAMWAFVSVVGNLLKLGVDYFYLHPET